MKFQQENVNRMENFEDLGIDDSIILKLILKK
jgi:hypothetical protein